MTELTGWDLNAGRVTANAGNKLNFTKFQEGITKIRILDNAPHMRWAHWMPQFTRKVTCAGFGCPIDEINKALKAQGQDPRYDNSRAFSLNIYNLNENRHELMEEGVTMIEELKMAIIDAFGEHPNTPIQNFVFKVKKRRNSSNRWVWSVDLESVSELNASEEASMEERVDRAEYFKPPTVEQVAQLLAVDSPEKDQRIAMYNQIMGFVRQEGEDDLNLGVEV